LDLVVEPGQVSPLIMLLLTTGYGRGLCALTAATLAFRRLDIH
jgi:hypothetical protein